MFLLVVDVSFVYFNLKIKPLTSPTGDVHNMLRVRVCAAHMFEFWAQNSLDKGPSSANFSETWVGWLKFAK